MPLYVERRANEDHFVLSDDEGNVLARFISDEAALQYKDEFRRSMMFAHANGQSGI